MIMEKPIDYCFIIDCTILEQVTVHVFSLALIAEPDLASPGAQDCTSASRRAVKQTYLLPRTRTAW